MNQLTQLLLLFAFSTFFCNVAVAQEKYDITSSIKLYKIQLGVFKNPSVDKLKALKPFGVIQSKKMDNGLQQLFLGDYKSKAAAQKVLPQVNSQGFTDAFVRSSPMMLQVPKSIVTDTSYVIVFGKSEPSDKQLTDLSAIGKLYFQTTQKTAQLVMGKYAEIATAQKALSKLQDKGYADAKIEPYRFSFLTEPTNQ